MTLFSQIRKWWAFRRLSQFPSNAADVGNRVTFFMNRAGCSENQCEQIAYCFNDLIERMEQVLEQISSSSQ